MFCASQGMERQGTSLDEKWKKAWGTYERQEKADYARQMILATSPNMIGGTFDERKRSRC